MKLTQWVKWGHGKARTITFGGTLQRINLGFLEIHESWINIAQVWLLSWTLHMKLRQKCQETFLSSQYNDAQQTRLLLVEAFMVLAPPSYLSSVPWNLFPVIHFPVSLEVSKRPGHPRAEFEDLEIAGAWPQLQRPDSMAWSSPYCAPVCSRVPPMLAMVVYQR